MVKTYLDRSLQFQQYWLGDEYLASFLAKMTNFYFKELNLFPRSTPSYFEQPIDDGVEVHIVLIRHAVVPSLGGDSCLSELRAELEATQIRAFTIRITVFEDPTCSLQRQLAL